MKFSLSILYIASLSYNLTAQAAPNSVKAPSIFEAGPTTGIAKIKLKTDEMASLILLEGVASVASFAVLVGGCQILEGEYPFKITADGSLNKPEANFVIVNSPKKSEPFVLSAMIETPDNFRGQKVKIRQSKKSKLKETAISDYSANVTFNSSLTLMSMHSEAKILGQNNIFGLYRNELLKHFYLDKKQNSKNQKILGWGMSSLSETSYPINTFWARFKAIKTNGQLKRIVLQLDRLTGISSCRIAIDGIANTKKEKRKSFIVKGMMTISKTRPHKALSITADF